MSEARDRGAWRRLAGRQKPLAVLAAALTVIMALAVDPLSFDTSFDDNFLGENPYYQTSLAVDGVTGEADAVYLIVSPGNATVADAFAGAAEMERRLEVAFPGIRTHSIGEFEPLIEGLGFEPGHRATDFLERLRELSDDAPLLVAADARSYLVVGRPSSGARILPATLDKIARAPCAGVANAQHISLHGLRASIEGALRRDLALLTATILLIGLAAIVYGFRRFAAVAFAGAVTTCAGISVLALFSLLSYAINVVNVITFSVVAMVSLALCIHLLSATREHRRALPAGESVAAALSSVFRPAVFTVVTTAVAFGSFALNASPQIQAFGVSTAVCLLVTFLLTMLMAPVFLSWYTRRVPPQVTGRLVEMAVSGLGRVRRLATIVFVVLIVAAAILVGRIDIRSDVSILYPRGSSFAALHNEFSDRFFSLAGVDLYVPDTGAFGNDNDERLSTLLAAGDSLRVLPGVVAVVIFSDSGTVTLDTIEEVAASGEGVMRLQVSESAAIPGLVEQVRGTLDRAFPDVDVRLSSSVLAYEYLDRVTSRSLLESLLVSSALIVLCLYLISRSFKATLVAILANSAPLGLLCLIVVGAGFALNLVTILSVVAALGIIVDDTIYVIDRRARGLARDTTGIEFSLLTTTMILAAGSATFLMSSFEPTRTFGLLCAVVFIAAVIADLTMLPYLLDRAGVLTADRAPGGAR